MRYVVVGTLPPPCVGRSTALLELVSRLESDGHEVEMVPVGVGDPASRYGGAWAALGADTLWALLRRRAAGAVLVLQVEPALVGAQSGRFRRALGLGALSLALARWPEIEIRIDSFSDLPGGLGGRAAALLWQRATRVVVVSEAQHEMLCREAGLDPALVSIEAAAEAPASNAHDEWPPDGDDPQIGDIQALVRRRAAAERLRSGRSAPDGASRMLEASLAPPGGGRKQFGLLEPVVRFAYERPALREPLRVVARVGTESTAKLEDDSAELFGDRHHEPAGIISG